MNNIYPNPTSKFINIKYNINDSKKVSCYIYNSFGILIKHIKQVNVFQIKIILLMFQNIHQVFILLNY